MKSCCICLAAILLAADQPTASSKALEKLQAIHQQEATTWRIHVDSERRVTASFNPQPVYIWTNPTRAGGQHGSVFIWTYQGRPVAIGSTYSHPAAGTRKLYHEFHSLAADKFFADRAAGGETWAPRSGVVMERLPGSPAPETSAPRRLIQMRALAREFSAHSIDVRRQRWELRLLPQPLFRHNPSEGDAIDGAVFTFVTSAGTDPEVILWLEARKSDGGGAWHYRAGRFSDSNLFVQHKGQEVWSSIRDEQNQARHNADHTYRHIPDKTIEELPELADVIP